MKEDMLQYLYSSTLDGVISWQETSNPYTFITTVGDATYTIEKTCDDVVLCRWTENGEVESLIQKDQEFLLQLFTKVLDLFPNLKYKYNSYKKMEEKEEYRNLSVSLHKVVKRLAFEGEEERPRVKIKKSDFFFYAEEEKLRYVEPPMRQLETAEGFTPYNEANVILISAPGATGKTWMSKYVSQRLHIPILDLAKHDAVGASTIGGLLMKEVEESDIFIYHSGLRNGECAMIIDGLDEAAIHITQEGFEAFMKDVAFFAKDSKGLPFVILGRPSVMEDASLALETNGIKTTLLQIEPFTIEKAKEYIDNQLETSKISKYEEQYKKVRDYIIGEIGGFFKNESEMSKKVFERFIGYAPVLTSISKLLHDNYNYHSLLDELKSEKKQRIDLLVDIVERILKREQTKIHEEVLTQMFEHGRDEQYKSVIRQKCGTIDEQCYRIISLLVGKKAVYDIFAEEEQNKKYNEKMNKWIENHPFVKNSKNVFENIVFESYVVARLARGENNIKLAIEWLRKSKSCSYLLVDICDCLITDNTISSGYVPYLLSSFKALDTPASIGNVEILATDEVANTSVTCELVFGREENEREYEFLFTTSFDEAIKIPSPVSALNIDAPINIIFDDVRLDIHSPVSIVCRKVSIHSRDVILGNCIAGTNIIVECDQFEAKCSDGAPNLINRNNDKEAFRIITKSSLTYPFIEYRKSAKQLGFDNEDIFEVFKKFRRLVLMFRSHSKGILARYCSKVDKRIGKTSVGKAIIDKLMATNVLWKDNSHYYINYEQFAEVIGVKYDDIRSCNINAKTKDFLSTVISKEKK